MLYSIGKDSSVLLHLARKAFYPGRVPFPLLHVNTGWKFAEMIAFRDEIVKKYDLDLIEHINPRGAAENVTPFTHGSALYTDIMKTEGAAPGARRRPVSTPLSAARAATRKPAAPRSASIPSARRTIAGIRATSARNSGTSTTA